MVYRNKASESRTVFSFIASPVVTAPRPVNSAIHFARSGYRVVLIGYRNDNQKKRELLPGGAVIFRVDLRSRKIGLAYLRRIVAVVEFIGITVHILRKKRPAFAVFFNEVAAIALRFLNRTPEVRKIAWILEFPESYTQSIGEKLIHRLAVRSWSFADALVFPTPLRMAMSFVMEPALIHSKVFVIHNAPLLANFEHQQVATLSPATMEALEFISQCRQRNRMIIIYAGAVGNRYGWDFLIRGVGNCDSAVSLLILGQIHDLGIREYEEASQVVRNKDEIKWVGAVPYAELQGVMEQGDIGFVHYLGDNLNTYFSSPGKLYEYLKAGLAIMTDNMSCVQEYLERYEAGLYFSRPLDDAGMLKLLNGLDRQMLRVRKENARRLFEEKLSFERQMVDLIGWMKGQDFE